MSGSRSSNFNWKNVGSDDDSTDSLFEDDEYIEPVVPTRVKIRQFLKKFARGTYHGLLAGFRFPNVYLNSFPGFLMGYLQFFRNILLNTPVVSQFIMPEEPKDAFWVLRNFYDWVKSIPYLGWVVTQIAYGVQKISEWLAPVFKWLAPALPYIPIVGLGISALVSIRDYWKSDNKNFVSTFKFIGDIAGAVLLAVGLGLMTWGTGAVLIYTAPVLIVAAAAIVGATGLLKACVHFYKAYKEPEKRKEHIINGFKALLVAAINVTASLLTFFGMQIGQNLAAGATSTDWSFFQNAAQIYQSAAVATNVVLAAAGTLVVMTVGPKLYNGCKNLFRKCFGTTTETEKPSLAADKLSTEITDHINKLNAEMENTPEGDSSLYLARWEKKAVLTAAQNVLKGDATHKDLLAIESNAKKHCSVRYRLYQSSFFGLSKTESLVDRVKAIAVAKEKQSAKCAPRPSF